MSAGGDFELRTELSAPAETVWAHATTLEGVNQELRPLVRMTFPPDGVALDPARIRPGERVFRSWILLFGILPVDYDDLTFDAFEPPRRFLERSVLFTQKEWVHERIVEPLGEGSIVTDRIRFTPRVAFLAPVHAWTFRLVFRWRHRNLRRLFG